MLIVQATSLGGIMVEGARWELDAITNVRETQIMQLSVPCKDRDLIAYVAKQGRETCVVDKEKTSYSIIMRCIIREIRHLISSETKTMDTMVTVVPSDRTVESVLQYLFNPQKADKRFVQLIRSSASSV